ncbi:MAG: type II secretion system protein [Verrucomicrobiota bacterium]
MRTFQRRRRQTLTKAAFTLTELLVVVCILALLAAMRLPVLCRTKTPTQLAQCMSNCRQIAAAVMVYMQDNRDEFPFGQRVSYGSQVTDADGWPMLIGEYLGMKAGSTNGSKVYLCPSEKQVANNWIFQLHFQGNRYILSDTNDLTKAVRSVQMTKGASLYWMIMEKGPWDFASTRTGGLASPALLTWNYAPGCQQYRRHSGGMTAAAADGHAEWLRTPNYQPGAAMPKNWNELGDCSNGAVGAWDDNTPPTRRIKLWSRYQLGSSPLGN